MPAARISSARRIVSIVTIALLSATVVVAQFDSGRRGGRIGRGFRSAALRELGRESVIEELQLTAEQQGKIEELAATPPENSEEMTELFAAMRCASCRFR